MLTGVSNTSLSALFNALIFLRAVEDHKRRLGRTFAESGLLTELVYTSGTAPLNVRRLVESALEALALRRLPSNLIDLEGLSAFQSLDLGLLQELVSDFYRNRFAKFYEYDFSLISKHALSRIYEHYVSLLRLPDDGQLSLLPRMAIEVSDKSYGAVYTPSTSRASLCAPLLRNRIPLAVFRRLKILDPACGSGIFLRAFFGITERVPARGQNV